LRDFEIISLTSISSGGGSSSSSSYNKHYNTHTDFKNRHIFRHGKKKHLQTLPLSEETSMAELVFICVNLC